MRRATGAEGAKSTGELESNREADRRWKGLHIQLFHSPEGLFHTRCNKLLVVAFMP